MPIVHIDLLEGREPERIEAMIRAVSEATAASLQAPIASVRVVVHEMAPHQFGVGGDPWPVVAARRQAEASAASNGPATTADAAAAGPTAEGNAS